MGVRGFMGYVSRNVRPVRCDLLQQGGGVVLIDGPNFKFQLLQQFLPRAMRNWELVDTAPCLSVHYTMSKFIEALNNAGITVVSCYDNDAANVAEYDKKAQTHVARERRNMEMHRKVEGLHCKLDPRNPNQAVGNELRGLNRLGMQPTMFGKLVQVEYLGGYNGISNCIFHTRKYDADTIIMRAMVEFKGQLGGKPVLGVLSADSDFLTCPNIRLIPPDLFDVNGMFMRAIREGRKPTELSCEVLHGEHILSTLGFKHPPQIGELAALAGNDYTTPYLDRNRPSDFRVLSEIIRNGQTRKFVWDQESFNRGLKKTLECCGINAPPDIEEDLRRLDGMAAGRPEPVLDYQQLSLKDFLYERCLTGRSSNCIFCQHTTQIDKHAAGYLALMTPLHTRALSRILEMDKLYYSESRIVEPTVYDVDPVKGVKLQSFYGDGVLSLLSKLTRVASEKDMNSWEHFEDVPNSCTNYADAIIGCFLSRVKYFKSDRIDALEILAASILTGRISKSMEPTPGVAKWVALEGVGLGSEEDIRAVRQYLLFEQQHAVTFLNAMSDVYGCQLIQGCTYFIADLVGLLTEDPLEPYRIIDGRVLGLLKYAPQDMFRGGMGRLKKEAFTKAQQMQKRVAPHRFTIN